MFTPEALAGYFWTAIWTLINLFILYWVLKRFLFKPFQKTIEGRQEKIHQALDEAQAKLAAAQSMEEKRREQLAAALKEATDTVNEARQKAQLQEAQLLKQAHEEAQALLDQSREENQRMRQNLYLDMRQEIADLALSIASKVIGQAMDQGEQMRLINEILDQEIQRQQSQKEGG